MLQTHESVPTRAFAFVEDALLHASLAAFMRGSRRAGLAINHAPVTAGAPTRARPQPSSIAANAIGASVPIPKFATIRSDLWANFGIERTLATP